MTQFYKRLSPALGSGEWGPPLPLSDVRARLMRVSPGRELTEKAEAPKGGFMAKDDRDVLEVLESELDFLTKGGYDRSVRTPREPTVFFQDSPICPEYPCRTHNEQCLLIQFVPEGKRSMSVPCHHIPLNEKGETVDSMLAGSNREGAEQALKAWIRRAIGHLRQERSKVVAAS